MNKVFVIGRLTADATVRQINGGEHSVADFTLAVDRMKKDSGADFIRCKAWDKRAEVAEKYFTKGLKIAVFGHIQTGSYEKDGTKFYTTDIIVDDFEFCEKKSAGNEQAEAPVNDDFMKIPESIAEELPFN